jgi:lactosylceramide 4-alpha-galactosyltransferase
LKSDKLTKSVYKIVHTADILRLLLLWKFGGYYLDTDMIVQKSFDSLPTNFACRANNELINNAFLSFDKKNGRKLVEMFIEDLVKNFNGDDWGSNGPKMITRVSKKLCQTEDFQKMIDQKDCDGFHVLPQELCYAIPYFDWEKLVEEKFAEQTMKAVENSFTVHFWNKFSKSFKLQKNSTAAYVQLAKCFCPRVMAACGEFF